MLFGGLNIQFFDTVEFDQTFTWNGSIWTPRIVSTNPGKRVGHTMTTDSLGRIMLFGGTNANSQYVPSLNDVWIWNKP